MTDETFSRTFCGSDKGAKICNSAYSTSKNVFQQCYNVLFYKGSRYVQGVPYDKVDFKELLTVAGFTFIFGIRL